MTKEEAARKACPFSFGQRFMLANKLDPGKGQEVAMNCLRVHCEAWRTVITPEGPIKDCVRLRK